MGERQQFTIAREQAIKKMRSHALSSPEQYVLELIQAAVFSGATWISVDVDDDAHIIGWVGGTPLSADGLDTLFDHLFMTQGRADIRAMQQVAIAVNAVSTQRLRSLVIESGDGTTGGSVRADVGKNATVRVTAAQSLLGTYVYVGFKAPGLFRSRQVWNIEHAVTVACAHLPVPLTFNGDLLHKFTSSGPLECGGLARSVRFEEDGRRGILGIVRHGVTPTVRIVVGGVTLTSVPIPGLGEQTGGVLCDDALRKTADGADVVRDEAWAAMIRAAQPHVLPMLHSAHAAVSTAPFVAPSAPDVPGDSALPDPIPQAGVRPDLPLTSVAGLDSESVPVFVVAPADALASHTGLDAARFPWRVLVLSVAAQEALAQHLPHHVLTRLTQSEDASFARDRVRRLQPEWQSPPILIDDAVVTVHITRGAAPRAHVGRGIPVALRTDAITRVLFDIEPALTGVRLVVDAVVRPDDSVLWQAVLTGVAAWLDTHPEQVASALAHQIVVHTARPHLVRDDTGLHLVLSLPPVFVAHRDALLAEPLISGVSAADLARVQGSTEVLSVPIDADLDAVEPLEERLGRGHLDHPQRSSTVLVAVGATQGQWMWLDAEDSWADGVLTDIVALAASYRPQVERPGFVVADHPSPGLVHLVRDGHTPTPAFPGVSLLARRVLDPSADPPSAMARAVMWRAASTQRVRLAGLDPSDSRLRITAAHGVSIDERYTVPLTLDEAVALFGDDVPLRFDDAPVAWSGRPDDAVASVIVAHEWGHGWLALPRPFDASLGVVMSVDGVLVGLPDLDTRWPCRGALTLTRSLDAGILADLDLAARDLYAQLLGSQDADAAQYARALQPSSGPLARALHVGARTPSQPLSRDEVVHALNAAVTCDVTWSTGSATTVHGSSSTPVSVQIGTMDAARLTTTDRWGPVLLRIIHRAAQAGDAPIHEASAAVARWVLTRKDAQ